MDPNQAVDTTVTFYPVYHNRSGARNTEITNQSGTYGIYTVPHREDRCLCDVWCTVTAYARYEELGRDDVVSRIGAMSFPLPWDPHPSWSPAGRAPIPGYLPVTALPGEYELDYPVFHVSKTWDSCLVECYRGVRDGRTYGCMFSTIMDAPHALPILKVWYEVMIEWTPDPSDRGIGPDDLRGPIDEGASES